MLDLVSDVFDDAMNADMMTYASTISTIAMRETDKNTSFSGSRSVSLSSPPTSPRPSVTSNSHLYQTQNQNHNRFNSQHYDHNHSGSISFSSAHAPMPGTPEGARSILSSITSTHESVNAPSIHSSSFGNGNGQANGNEPPSPLPSMAARASREHASRLEKLGLVGMLSNHQFLPSETSIAFIGWLPDVVQGILDNY